MSATLPAYIIDQQTKRIQREVDANHTLENKNKELIRSLRQRLDQSPRKKDSKPCLMMRRLS